MVAVDLIYQQAISCHVTIDVLASTTYGRMSWGASCPTITEWVHQPIKGRFLHPVENRAITLREAAVLQGFPSRYSFEMSRGRYAAAQMIGNAFPLPKFAGLHAGVYWTRLSANSLVVQLCLLLKHLLDSRTKSHSQMTMTHTYRTPA